MNEVPTKVNWHYLRWVIDTEARRNVELQLNDQIMDWTDGYDRLKAATPSKNLDPLIASLPPGGRVLIVFPVTSRADDWDAPWTELVRRRGAQWGAALASDSSLRFVKAVPVRYRRATRIGVRGVIYEKTSEKKTETG